MREKKHLLVYSIPVLIGAGILTFAMLVFPRNPEATALPPPHVSGVHSITLYYHYYEYYYQHFAQQYDENSATQLADYYAQYYADYYSADPSGVQTISANSARLIQQFEGYRASSYQDMAGLPTIGYGHQIKHGQQLTEIDHSQALQLFVSDLQEAEDAVNRLVQVPLTRNQFSALVSLVYNIGAGQFENSSLLRLLNEGRYAEAADEFLRWKHVNKRAVRGLKERRSIERALFLS